MFWMFLLTFAISEMMNGCSTEGNQIDRCPPDVTRNVYALEGEHVRVHCRLRIPSTPHTMDLQTHGSGITWFKDLHENGSVEIIGGTDRLTVEGVLLSFWPATVNDSGRYFCSFFNGTHNITGENMSLNVASIIEGCYTEELTYERDADIGTSIKLLCPKMEDYENNKEDLKWYKDCQEYIHTGSSLQFNKLKKENAGYYTCKLTFEHSGVQYNTTRTLTLTLKEPPAKPNLIYPVEERIEVVLGENRTINCTAFANSTRNPLLRLNWYFDNSPVASCNRAKSVCKDSRRDVIISNGKYTIRPLVFTQIKEEHLNQNFNCVLTTYNQRVSGYIILQEKGKSNVHGVVKLLTSIIVVLVFVAIVCVYFHVQIVLCFRDLTGRDDTLEDDKEYDAYVLLLKSNETLLDAKEEQQFAFELLPAILEKQFGYRLCIFERNVPPGGSSADNILSYVNKCRRLIIILCEEYVDNECSSTYELMTGLYQVLVERKIKPILIEFKPISNPKLLPESLQLVLKSKRIVKWKGNKLALKNSYFWKKVRYLMPANGGQRAKHSQRNVAL
ncbi:interleukin-18 receptor 1-like [Chiloscyllium plagiosum]|uniref:interleukin-18 receptor 1-like n=1 Tax=Chiloscyllium plagiosum TaxID=36176 RepID=UPI001CB872ED|nr:interleukin-18 receptor 1-like [Chiloscyllium plagiosum]